MDQAEFTLSRPVCLSLPVEEVDKLLREKEVAIIPGSAFGASGEGYARISYAYSVDHLQTAMKRIREFLTEHGWMKK